MTKVFQYSHSRGEETEGENVGTSCKGPLSDAPYTGIGLQCWVLVYVSDPAV